MGGKEKKKDLPRVEDLGSFIPPQGQVRNECKFGQVSDSWKTRRKQRLPVARQEESWQTEQERLRLAGTTGPKDQTTGPKLPSSQACPSSRAAVTRTMTSGGM